MNRLYLQSKTTKTGDFDGTSIDVSALVGDWTLVLEAIAVSLPNPMRFTFQTSTDGFSTWSDGPTVSIVGATGSGAKRFSFEKHDFPDLPIGIANATMRVSVRHLSGGSVTYQSFVDYGSI